MPFYDGCASLLLEIAPLLTLKLLNYLLSLELTDALLNTVSIRLKRK